MKPTDEDTLDIRPIRPTDRHPTIFETFDGGHGDSSDSLGSRVVVKLHGLQF